MATITLKGNAVDTAGNLPEIGSKAGEFTLTKTDLSDVSLAAFKGKRVVLNIYPSIDTGICAASTRYFNTVAADLENTVILCVSKDLPFAHARFCGAEGIENVIPTSALRNSSFSDNYHVDIMSGAMAGLMSRAVIVLDEEGTVLYTEQVPEIVQEPNYEAALAALNA